MKGAESFAKYSLRWICMHVVLGLYVKVSPMHIRGQIAMLYVCIIIIKESGNTLPEVVPQSESSLSLQDATSVVGGWMGPWARRRVLSKVEETASIVHLLLQLPWYCQL